MKRSRRQEPIYPRVIFLKCCEDSPAWDQRVDAFEVVAETEDAWIGGPVQHSYRNETRPKFAWKEVKQKGCS